jgi:hypothetical protein
MKTSTDPYALPQKLEADLAQVLAYWEGLKRGEAGMPFWDDVNLSAMPDLSKRLMLIDVFDKPLRFRLGTVGAELAERYHADLANKFVDEIETNLPLQYLNSQCSATVEKRAPSYYRHGPAKNHVRSAENYSRLLMPMWGNGHIGMLLGALAWG